MTTRAFQKVYTKIDNITKATVTLRATGVGNDELATVGGKLAQVVKIMGDNVTLQVFAGTEGLATDSEVVFHGEPPKLKVSDNLAGRFFNAYGEPLEGGEQIEGEAREIGGPTVNPFKRKQPSELIATGIAGIDLNNTIVSGQKIPFFADPDQPYNAVMANVALRAKADKIILGGMGLTNDDFLYFKQVFENAGALDRIVSFVNTTENPPVERLLVPDMALTAAEYFAVDKGEKVLVLLTDMTLYADALAIVSNRMDQIPSKDSMPGSLYSDLAKIYEKAVQLPNGGSITIIAVTTLSGGDITHAVPDNTGYITEGQLFLRNDSDTGRVIVDPFRSLSRLKQLVIGKKTREDHPQVMNACVRLYADAANAKTKLENGFDLSDYDERALKFAYDYSEKLLSIDVNMEIPEGTEVQFWTGFGEDISNALDKLLDEFTAETGIEVNHVTQSGYEGLFESITLSASSGNVPQLALAYPDHMASYVDSGILVQLDYYMETDEGEDKISAEDFYSDYMQENFQIYFDENGEPYCMGVPFNKSTEVMSYNADFFDWASKRDSGIKVPETWQEVRTVGTKIRALMEDCYGKYVGKDGVAYSLRQDAVEKGGGLLFNFAAINEKNFIPFGSESGANFFITTCRQWGGTYTEIDTESRSGYLAFDSEEVREGLQFMKDLYDDGLIGVPSDFQNSGPSGSPTSPITPRGRSTSSPRARTSSC